jgi:signal peptidase
MALAQVTVGAPADLAGAFGHAWARAAQVVDEALTPTTAWTRGALAVGRDRARELAWPWAAWTSLLSPARWWTWVFVALTTRLDRPRAARQSEPPGEADDRGPVALRSAPVASRSVLGAYPARSDRSGGARAGRRRWRPTGLGVFRTVAWIAVVAGVGLFATSLAVPAWYGLHGQRLLIVTSGSMAPFVQAGDVAVLQQIDDPSQLRVGQVATFWPPGSKHLVTHRIVDLKMLPAVVQNDAGKMVPQLDAAGHPIERPYIYTKGDANATRDPNATPLVRVRGVVVAAYAGWGVTLGWAQSPAGRFTLLAPPLALLASLEVVDLIAERRRPARRPAGRPVTTPEVNDALGTL